MSTISINDTKVNRSVKESVIDNWARNRVLEQLKQLPTGKLVVHENGQSSVLGNAASELCATIVVEHPAFYRDVMLGGSMGAAESYMLGVWHSPDLVAVVRVLAANINWLNRFDKSALPISRIADRIYHWFNRNTELGSKKNIAAHYDLSNDFFSLFLDPTMMYSSAIFKAGVEDLDQASIDKLDAICQKLDLKPDDHLLEIGTGWGGLAIHAAKNYGCRVTTTTISQQQYNFAVERVNELGLNGKIELLLQDYRKLEGHYDKLVSIEMIEAVGHEYYQQYFSKCSSLLKDDGVMLIQAITIPNQRYEHAKKSVDFIQRYIFPGGSLPSHEVIERCLSKGTDMTLLGFEEIGLSYAKTLHHWRQRFLAKLDKVKALGFDETFIRMWDFYLCYCEGGFRERAIGTSQLVFAKPGWRFGEEQKHASSRH